MNILTLKSAGLTTVESKVYLLLQSLEKATAKEITTHGRIERSEVYCALNSLQSQGLIYVHLGKPRTYEAVSLQNALSIFLKQKKVEIAEMEEAIEKMEKNKKTVTALTQEEFFLYAFSPIAAGARVHKILDETEQSIDYFAATRSILIKGLAQDIDRYFRILNKNIKLRIIMPSVEENERLSDALTKLRAYPNFHVKFMANPPVANFVLFDSKEIWIGTGSILGINKANFMVIRNRQIAELFKYFFEFVWEKQPST
jgi:sugar-specific transcriptional regulator TrmB